MGKEAKIGLAVVATLLLVFGGLLLRKLIATDNSARSTPDTVAASLPTPARDKPTVVTAQKDRPEQAARIKSGLWGKRQSEADAGSDATADAPRASFMPAESRLRNRYASDQEPADESDAATPVGATGNNPFGRGAAMPDDANEADDAASDGAPKRLEVASDEASELKPRAKATKPSRNPLRRLSAEVPLGDAPTADEIPTTIDEPLPAAETDPNSFPPVEQGEPLGLDEPQTELQPIEQQPADIAPQEDVAPPVSAVRPRYESRVAEQTAAATEEASPPANGKYTIQPNDNLWIISEKVYGNGRYFKAIHEFNRSKLPRADLLTVGTEIAVPPAAVLEQNFPQLVPKQRRSAVVKPRTMQPASTRQSVVGSDVYIVEEGDTLFDIARYELGKASRWSEIYDMNREALGDDFNYLQPGTELRMPPRASTTDAVTRQRDGGTRR